MTKYVLLVMMVLLSMAGCEMITSALKNPEQIHAILAAQAEGEYEVEIRKDAQVLYVEKWSCAKGDSDKLKCVRR